jgi:hypothetical protein
MKRRVIFLTLLLLLLVVQNATALASTNYRLDWFIPMTTSSGVLSSSTNYAINYSLGQTVIGNSASTHYAIGLGYWNGLFQLVRLYLPFISNIH